MRSLMLIEEPAPQPKPIDLERLSVDELKQRIENLKTEIEACEGELAKKSAHKSAADALFGGEN
ncbi:MAG: DUF1192 domain-containing protein [Pseudomonadota bacterium]